MIALVIAALASLGGFTVVFERMEGSAWMAGFTAIITFLVVFIGFNLVFGRKLKAIMELMKVRQEGLRDEINRFVNRQGQGRGMSQGLMQRKIEEMTKVGVLDSIKILDQAKPLYKWSLLAEKNVNMNKLVLYYSIRQYKEVDELLGKVMVLDPLVGAMKMAREYHKKEFDKVDKTYSSAIRRFSGEKGKLIYSTYAWTLVKRKEIDRALEVLNEAREKTADENIERNWQAVANNKIGQFSNNFLGEEWYSLHLEKPKQSKSRGGKGAMRRDPRIGKVSRKMR